MPRLPRITLNFAFWALSFLPLGACSGLSAEGWTTDGNVFSASFTELPASPLKLRLDLGSVSSLENATIEARVQNSGSSDISYGAIIQESGLVQLCSCTGGALFLGALEPGGCLRIRVKPVKIAGGTEKVTFRLTGFVEIDISATLPSSEPTSSGGLVISNNCED